MAFPLTQQQTVILMPGNHKMSTFIVNKTIQYIFISVYFNHIFTSIFPAAEFLHTHTPK